MDSSKPAGTPLELLVDICEAAEAALGGGDVNICEEMGKFACGMSFNSTHRLLFKFGDVDWLIERASKAWSSHFDAGDLQARRTSGGAVIIELVGVSAAPDAACHLIKGWMEKAAEVSGEDAFGLHDGNRAQSRRTRTLAIRLARSPRFLTQPGAELGLKAP